MDAEGGLTESLVFGLHMPQKRFDLRLRGECSFGFFHTEGSSLICFGTRYV